MNIEAIRKAFNSEAAKATLRKRHGLADDAPVEFKSLVMNVEMQDPFTFKARITTDTLDRDGEVMIPQGMDATEFDKTGTIFWNHNYDLPVGKPKGRLNRADRYVDAYAEFAKRPEDYQGEFFPDFARAMVAQDIVKGVSVGFLPMEGRQPTTKDFERYGPDVKRVWSKWKLLEWSLAPVQCNPDAMIQNAIAKGIITREQLPDDLKATMPDMPMTELPDPKCPQCGVGEMLAMDTGMVRCKACGYEMPKAKDAKAATFPAVIAIEATDTTSFVKVTNMADLTEPAPIIVPRQLLYVITPPTQPVAPDPVKAAAEQVRIFVLKRQGRIYA